MSIIDLAKNLEKLWVNCHDESFGHGIMTDEIRNPEVGEYHG
jgi:hypothetical protein